METNKIIDISIELSDKTIIYPEDPIPQIYFRLKLANGDIANVGQMNTGIHHGTHVDVPIHFKEGAKSLLEIPLSFWFGKAYVIDLTSIDKCITKKDIEKKPAVLKYDKILFKTKNSLKYLKEDKFNENFIYIDGSAAKYLVDTGVKTVGLDYITVDPFGSPDFPAHNTFLRNEVVIIEGINLEKVNEGEYTLICLPIKIKGADGSPARAILIP